MRQTSFHNRNNYPRNTYSFMCMTYMNYIFIIHIHHTVDTYRCLYFVVAGAGSSNTWTRRLTSARSRTITTSSTRWQVTWSSDSAEVGAGSRCCVSWYSTHSIWRTAGSTTRRIIRTGWHSRTCIRTELPRPGHSHRHCRESTSC